MLYYSMLTQLGDVIKLDLDLENPIDFVKWTEKNYTYVQYNPNKPINRYGLSITSLDGGLSGIPDLDSLPEYNSKHNTNYDEKDFKVFTEVYYKNIALQNALEPIKDSIFRSHVLKLSSGGFFPVHRDVLISNFNSCRILFPLRNTKSPNSFFILDDKILSLDEGTGYFLNTAKLHTVFNASSFDAYWIIVNVNLNESTYKKIINLVKII